MPRGNHEGTKTQRKKVTGHTDTQSPGVPRVISSSCLCVLVVPRNHVARVKSPRQRPWQDTVSDEGLPLGHADSGRHTLDEWCESLGICDLHGRVVGLELLASQSAGRSLPYAVLRLPFVSAAIFSATKYGTGSPPR